MTNQSKIGQKKRKAITLDTCSRSGEQVGKPRKGLEKNMMHASFWEGKKALYPWLE